jgi:hypothetical protein
MVQVTLFELIWFRGLFCLFRLKLINLQNSITISESNGSWGKSPNDSFIWNSPGCLIIDSFVHKTSFTTQRLGH